MHARRLFENDPAADMSNSKLYVESLIVLQGRALAYYYVLVASDVIWTRKLETAATDGIYIYVNPDFFSGLANASQRAFLLAHEVGHIVLKHPFRGLFYKNRGYFAMKGNVQIPYSPAGYNHAGDYVINADLIAHGLEFIPVCLKRDNISRDDLVDSVYMDLYAEHKQKQEQQEQDELLDADESDVDDSDDLDFDPTDSDPCDEGDDAEGDEGDAEGDEGDAEGDADEGDSEAEGEADDAEADAESGSEGGAEGDDEIDSQDGSGSAGDPFEDTLEGETHDEHLEPDYDGELSDEEIEEQIKEDQDEVARRVDEAIDAVNDAAERGEVPVASSSPFESSGNRHGGGNASGTDWRTQLIDRVTRIGAAGEANWSRIHRRRYVVLGVLTPSYQGSFDRLAVSVDISGSVDRDALHQFLIEVAKMIDDLQPASGALIMFTNTSVVGVHEVYSGGELLDLEVPKGGGTTMSAATQFMEENGLEADVHLCFTDGELYGNDMQNLADNDVVMVLDGPPCTWTQRDIDKTGIETIVASDQAM